MEFNSETIIYFLLIVIDILIIQICTKLEKRITDLEIDTERETKVVLTGKPYKIVSGDKPGVIKAKLVNDEKE